MTATNHVIAGALIATAVHNPWAALPLAFLSHFVMDMLPHFGLGPKVVLGSPRYLWILFTDLAIAAVILIALLFNGEFLLVACAVAAASPDAIWGYYFYYEFVVKEPKIKNRFAEFLIKIQWAEFPGGMLVEIPWAITSGSLLVAWLSI